MKIIKSILYSILSLLIMIFLSVGCAVFFTICAILIIPFAIACWIYSLFLANGVDELCEQLKTLNDKFEKQYDVKINAENTDIINDEK